MQHKERSQNSRGGLQFHPVQRLHLYRRAVIFSILTTPPPRIFLKKTLYSFISCLNEVNHPFFVRKILVHIRERRAGFKTIEGQIELDTIVFAYEIIQKEEVDISLEIIEQIEKRAIS